MMRFSRWRENGENSVNGRCFDVGTTTANALERFRRTGDPFSGSADPSAGGNGSIMRLAPIALRWHHDPIAASDRARVQSRTTHAALEPVEASALLADILVDAVCSGSKDVVLRRRTSTAPKIHSIAQGSWREKRRRDIGSSPYVVHTLEAALWSVHNANTFAEAVILAANLGGDADTVAAVTGQIAGALWGLSSIPAEWLARLAWYDAIVDRARRLMDIALR
ncbi:MAG TPA: ADP-ribosylglycohydrolase family protein, partial [Candidatus Baltobacteraceae bacterium]|nr:ADP-ribosylglycohydrolase family protein [Candidatus Baltobacteraceae bacterium]